MTSVCVRIQGLVPCNKDPTARMAQTRQKFISGTQQSECRGLGLIWGLHSGGIFDLTLLSATAFGFHLPPSHPHPGQQERERGGRDWESYT